MTRPRFLDLADRAEAHPRWGRLLLVLVLSPWVLLGWVWLMVTP